ncbi:MAG: hypothetical protein NZL89_02820, partial [Leptospiraceae bacterium]|nr:hypothetical protein [Leptospiraceae bacterium]
DSNCNLLADRIPALRRYFRSLHVPAADKKKVPLIPVAFRALPESITLRYSDNSPQAVKCLTAQVLALGELGFLQDGYTLVLPALQSVRVNLAPYERAALLAQAGRNAYLALAELYRKNPALKVRLLLSNMVPYAQAQLLPFNELVGKFVALTPEELTAVKNAAVANNGAVVYIPDLASRIALAIDTAVIWQLWQTPRVPYYKDNAGEPILYEELLLQLRRALTETDAAGTLLERKLKAIYASYARDNDEKRKWGESINLPYQRASSERLMKQQLQLLFDLYDFSAVGLEPDTFISLEMPARQHFPLLHTLVRPLARKLGLDGKKDGATEAEIEDSLNYIRSSLAQTGK